MLWTDDEINLLKTHYPSKGSNIVGLIEKRSVHSIWIKAKMLGLSFEKERHYFGFDVNPPQDWCWWFSGLFDGEGCLIALIDNKTSRRGKEIRFPICGAVINLRRDDRNLLSSIEENLKIGSVIDTDHQKFYNPRSAPQSTWQSRDAIDIANVLVPFFEKYPLRSKKGTREFPLWKEAVSLCLDSDRIRHSSRVSEISSILRGIRGGAARKASGWKQVKRKEG